MQQKSMYNCHFGNSNGNSSRILNPRLMAAKRLASKHTFRQTFPSSTAPAADPIKV